MDLNSASIHDVIHPTAAFSQNSPPANHPTDPPEEVPWSESQLNPKNRVNSLDPPQNPRWRIDGSTGLGTQFYALPLNAGPLPPMRFDVFIPEEAGLSPRLREILSLNAAFHTKDADRVRRLGITNHILRRLQTWMAGEGELKSLYENLPFGSRIILENLDLDLSKMRITVAPTYYLEKQLLALAKLDKALGVPSEQLPQAVDIKNLVIVQQLSDSVCIVRLSPGKTDDGTAHGNDKLWILKALTSGVKYMYVELRNLLLMKPHPNVISRPDYLVTKICSFGGKRAVVGFMLPYHSGGGLRDMLPLLRINGRLTMDMRLKWAIQLTSAVLHVREEGRMFYPDLRLDNIILSETGDLIMVDFEQRGVWCEFAAPEINAIDFIRILATRSVGDSGNNGNETGIPEDTRKYYASILSKLMPDWEKLQSCEEYPPLDGAYQSYIIPWLCLDEREQEAAEVFMLGRVLWCIFEGQSAPHYVTPWQSYLREPDIEFPAYRYTPVVLRDLIDRCTRGRRPGLSSIIVRQKSKLVLRGTVGESSPEEVMKAAREYWRAEVEEAERFVWLREERKRQGAWDGNHFGRPRLREVLRELQAFRDAYS